MKKTMGELDTELCTHCPLPKEAQGTHGTPNGYYSCEGRYCKEAYETYLEDESEETDG